MEGRDRGFTLIEVLTVVAIIAILTAIAFPVFARARAEAGRTSDISAMNSLRSSILIYREDQGAFPPQLLGYATLYSSGPNMGNVIPADRLQGFLYPSLVDSVETLRPVRAEFSVTDTTLAVYPPVDPRALGDAPVWDTDGDGDVDSDDDVAGARQAFGPDDGSVCLGGGAGCSGDAAARFYSASGYDVAQVPLPGGGVRSELRYTLFWSSYGLGSGATDDDPRQLGYTDPPNETVVTWNSFHRDYEADGSVDRTKRDVVLFLGGNARPFDSRDLAERSWRVLP